ncbi:MAG TPA: class I SAM-dependent methyltransferase [Allocoleopsis sp.]
MTTLPGSDFDKISPTALLTAYVRQFTDIPYTKEISELTNALATVNQWMDREQANSVLGGLAVLVEGRYKAIEQVLSQFHATQILELASGLLPRGTILSQQPEITFIESDLPTMIQQKQQLTQQLVGERPTLHFLAIDATSNLNSSRLDDYFQPNRPVSILCEGLLMYLTFAEKQQVFANVREILQSFGGVWITPDLSTMEKSIPASTTPQQMEQMDRKFVSLTGRTIAENTFIDLDHAKQFVQEQGFQMEEFNALEVLDQLECLPTLGIERDIARELLTTISVFVLRLA